METGTDPRGGERERAIWDMAAGTAGAVAGFSEELNCGQIVGLVEWIGGGGWLRYGMLDVLGCGSMDLPRGQDQCAD
jgi:hypothetical protein